MSDDDCADGVCEYNSEIERCGEEMLVDNFFVMGKEFISNSGDGKERSQSEKCRKNWLI